jgi:hypothetical protein
MELFEILESEKDLNKTKNKKKKASKKLILHYVDLLKKLIEENKFEGVLIIANKEKLFNIGYNLTENERSKINEVIRNERTLM